MNQPPLRKKTNWAKDEPNIILMPKSLRTAQHGIKTRKHVI